jgi:hypothetical protein
LPFTANAFFSSDSFFEYTVAHRFLQKKVAVRWKVTLVNIICSLFFIFFLFSDFFGLLLLSHHSSFPPKPLAPMTDLLDNTVFSGFLLIAAGCTLALQSGNIK